MSDQTPPVPSKPPHLGQLVRRLREAAGLTRIELSQQTKIADSTIRNFETGRHLPTLRTLHKLLQHPAMALLPQLAKEAGLYPGLGGNGASEP